MSILEKIRTKSGLLVGIIALALLVFILESALDSGNRFFSGQKTIVGEVMGNEIGIAEFEEKVQKAIENEKQRSGKNAVDENQTEYIRNQVWNELLMGKIMDKQYLELGLAVSKEELFDMVQGKNPHPSVKQAFTNPQTGVFDPNQVIQFLKNMDKDETGATKERWLNFEQALKQERVMGKFNTLIKKGIFITKAEAARQYIAQNRSLKLNYVAQKYFSVADSLFKPTEEEQKKYYNENKHKYKQEFQTRSIEFVSFDIQPSSEDKTETLEEISKLASEFSSASSDSDYVNANADTKFSSSYQSKSQLTPFVDTLFRSPIGAMVGPYFDGTAYKIAKLTAVRMAPDSVKARHILIKAENGNTAAAKAKADSLKKLIQSGAKFEDLARTQSQDPGSAIKGGDLGFFKEGMMVKPFNDACFNGKIGDMPIVESQFGVHLIEITGKGVDARKVLISYLDRILEPSTKTFQQIYQKASAFAGQNTMAEAFNKSVTDQKLNKQQAPNFRDNDRNITGLQNARQVVKWAYEAKKGDVSKVFELEKKYVIAVLTEIKDKGVLAFEDVQKQVEAEVIKEKKAEKFIKDMASKSASATNVAQVSAMLSLPLDSAASVNFMSPYISTGRELSMIGTIANAKVGYIKKPIKGDNAVYLVEVINVTEPAPVKDYKSSVDQLANQFKSRVDYEVFESLKQKAGVEDFRANFY
jgi:peptidyl-prolyl cis-trans isomerase D